jgi:hypothetical protein
MLTICAAVGVTLLSDGLSSTTTDASRLESMYGPSAKLTPAGFPSLARALPALLSANYTAFPSSGFSKIAGKSSPPRGGFRLDGAE